MKKKNKKKILKSKNKIKKFIKSKKIKKKISLKSKPLLKKTNQPIKIKKKQNKSQSKNLNQDGLISKLVKFQFSLKPKINLKINFSLEKYIQAFFDKIANSIAQWRQEQHETKSAQYPIACRSNESLGRVCAQLVGESSPQQICKGQQISGEDGRLNPTRKTDTPSRSTP